MVSVRSALGLVTVLVLMPLTACAAPKSQPRTSSLFGTTPKLASLGTTDPELSQSCVLYARAASGIDLSGDAFAWWDAAAGRFLRGQLPEIGAVLVLSRTDRLQRGHLAVVSQVLDSRDILVDHANWVRGTILTSMQVRDVSPNNDWTELRFLNPDYGVFGTVYRANGFIYPSTPVPTTTAVLGQLWPQVTTQ